MNYDFDLGKISELLGNNYNQKDVKSYLNDFNTKYWVNTKKCKTQNDLNDFYNTRFYKDYPPTEEGFVKYYLRVRSRKIPFLC